MSPTTIAFASAGSIFAGSLLGLALRRIVPDHHLSADSKDAIKVGASMISMMAALVLGLLVGSAKSKFDSTNDAITRGGARVILLDRVLKAYGPETREIREDLRLGVVAIIDMLWPEERSAVGDINAFERFLGMEQVLAKVRGLKPQTDAQRTLQEEALQIGTEILLSRWVQIEATQVSLPTLFLVILLFWLTILYTSFGLLAPRNATVITVMLIGALALGTALFLILEMNRPMGGAMKISSGPMRKALEHLGR